MSEQPINKLDEIASKYDPSSPEKDFDYWLLLFDFEVLKKFLIGEKVIELGYGRGLLTERLAKVSKELIIVEGSKKNLENVVFFSGLEHVDKDTGYLILKKIKTWLKPEGRLHIVVPNAYSLHRRVAYYMGIIKDVHEFSERDKLLGHKRVYDKETLFRELRECGYKIFHWEGIFLKPLPNSFMMNLDEKIIRGFYEISKELPDYCAHIYVCATIDTKEEVI